MSILVRPRLCLAFDLGTLFVSLLKTATTMDISEYQPPPPRSEPPSPTRKNRSKLIMGALFVATFLVTLAVANRHEIAEHFRRGSDAKSLALVASTGPGKPPQTTAKPASPPERQVAVEVPPLPPQTSQAADNSPFK
jgi:hypothetical protein